MPYPHNLGVHRETREGWPRLTPETNGNFWSTCTFERVLPFLPWLIRWAPCTGTRDFLSCLRCISQPCTKYFFLTAHYFTSFVSFAHPAGHAVVPRRLSFNMCLYLCTGKLSPVQEPSNIFFSQVSAHLALKGLIDPVKELEKVNKKNALLKQQIEKLTKLVQGMEKIYFIVARFLVSLSCNFVAKVK
jgi:hypothetical protein